MLFAPRGGEGGDADLTLSQETLDSIDQVEKEIPLSYGEDGLRFL